MHESQRLVAAFHRALKHPVSIKPQIMRPQLRAALIFEEALETVYALYRACGWTHENVRTVLICDLRIALQKLNRMSWEDRDFVSMIAHELCDLKYVLDGTAVEMGLDLEPLFNEVHRANMAKIGGGTREDGKTLKPVSWTPPRIEELIEEQERNGISYGE